MAPERVSVIVPALNEEIVLPSTLESLRDRGFHEVIVVDGGSRDRTIAVAAPLSTRVLEESGGLARQLNRGAREATGDVFLFHYADLRLPEGALGTLRRALEAPEVVGGAFALDLDSPRVVFRWIAWCANFRTRLGFGPFGDQAIFARRDAFERVGGYPSEEVFEDLGLIKRLKRSGRFVILHPPVLSSVRRWEADGLLTTTWRHFWASILYLLGAERRALGLKRWLQRRREGGA